MQYKLIYLTGAPATGKSSLCRELKSEISPLEVIEYGAELTKYINKSRLDNLTQDHIRDQSSQIITKQDIDDLDIIILEKIRDKIINSHVILDSHAVTKEHYGYRVTAFSPTKILNLNPSLIVNLYTDSDTVIDRIKEESLGRPMISKFEADFHTNLQSSLSIAYGFHVSIPIYYLDSNVERIKLVNWFVDKLK